MSELKFKCSILNKSYEKGAFAVYSFTTRDVIPETQPLITLDKKVGMRHGKMSGFNLGFKVGGNYVIEANIELSKKSYNGIRYKNIVVKNSYQILSEEEDKDYLKTMVSPARYELIVSVYPDFVKRVRENKEIDLSLLPGIKEKSFSVIKEKIKDTYWKADLMKWLIPLGITDRMLNKLLGIYKTPGKLRKVLHDNPYTLTQIRGLSFKRVDDLTMKLFPDKRLSPERITACVTNILSSMGNMYGDTLIKLSVLAESVTAIIPECADIYEDVIRKSDLFYIDGDEIGLQHFYNSEKYIIDKLYELMNAKPIVHEQEKDYIKVTEKKLGFKLSKDQKDIITSDVGNVMIITGHAGTGKTSVIRGLIERYSHASIALCSLSAKAADRMKEVTGMDAYTIHRLLGFDGIKFKYNKDNPLPYRIVIIDEGSTAGLYIFKCLLESIEPGTKLIIVGDHGQLPPIGAANVFYDLLSSDLPIFKLDKIYRQAQRSGIVVDANFIRQGINPFKQ